jgi:hypothetical protein
VWPRRSRRRAGAAPAAVTARLQRDRAATGRMDAR